jgi:hypothetical protein
MLRALAHQTMWHVVVRLVSAACSFLLFSLIARKLADAETQSAFFFLFSLGFGLAALRLFAQLATAMNGQARSTVRLQQVRQGLGYLALTLPLTVPLLGIILWIHTSSVFVVIVACLVVCLAAIDCDLLRAVVHRGPIFPSAFAVGTIFALIGLSLHPQPDFKAVCFWILVQWIPVSALNIAAVRRLQRCRVPRTGSKHWLHFASVLLLAVFDGLILNAPFLGWFTPSPSTGIDLSLGIRVFVASLPMQPLLLHWANSEALAKLTKHMRVGIALGFSMVLLISGVFAGIAFMLLYILVSGKPANTTAFVIYLLLLASYSFYASQMRLSAWKLHTYHRLGVLVVVLFIFVVAFGLYEPSLRLSALKVGLLQAFSLLACALALNLLSRWKTVR